MNLPCLYPTVLFNDTMPAIISPLSANYARNFISCNLVHVYPPPEVGHLNFYDYF